MIWRVACCLGLAASVAEGQGPLRVLARVDAIASSPGSVQVGVGVHALASTYVRVEASGAIGRSTRGPQRTAGRLDLTSRFVFDPFGESRRAIYGIGGMSAMATGGTWEPRLVVGVGVEGRRRAGGRWALEVALGGGVRAGIVLRQARPNRR